MPKYTLTFDRQQLRTFYEVLERLEENSYVIHKAAEKVSPDDYYSDYTTEIETDEMSCLTFRMGMKDLKIRRERTEEELAEEKAIEERHKVKVTVMVPKDDNQV